MRALKRPSPVEWACGLSLAVVLAAAWSVPTRASHADPPAPSLIQRCMEIQDDHRSDPELTGSCQVGSVRNP